MMGKKILKIVGIGLGLALALLLLAGGWFYLHLRGSLPQLDGERTLDGLSQQVTVQRDELGTATIRASNRLDLARATGFVHAQERFFQMDLLRRSSAGELSGLLGSPTLQIDKRIRIHQFRDRAKRVLEQSSAQAQALLEAYSKGVNAGLQALDNPPFEYLLLRAKPAPWRPEDSTLVVYAMYLTLQDDRGRRERALGTLYDTLPLELADFLAPPGTSWDAPLQVEEMPLPAMPGPEVFDLRTEGGGLEGGAHRAAASHTLDAAPCPQPIASLCLTAQGYEIGSNNWALAGSRSSHGGSIVANDMHLGLDVPNIWFRVRLVAEDEGLDLLGVSLPGTPDLIAGSNTRIAWGYTNAYGDWSDVVILEEAGEDRYLTPEGPRPYRTVIERILLKDGSVEELEVVSTIWGPVIGSDRQGRRLALRWVAHDVEGLNFNMMGLGQARTAEQALRVAAQAGIPAQNLVVGDSRGHIAWTVMGPVPRRYGHDGRLPSSWADGSRGWDGYLSYQERPKVIDPPRGQIWSANARVASGQDLALLGDGGYANAARARQIRDGLAALDQASETDMLAVHLDDRALYLQRWRDLLLEELDEEALQQDPRRRHLQEALRDWGGRASVDSVGYRMVREFHSRLRNQVLETLTGPVRQADRDFNLRWIANQSEHALWTLVQQRPAHLLDPRHRSAAASQEDSDGSDRAGWSKQVLAVADSLLDEYLEDGTLDDNTWGAFNIVVVDHPVSRFIPGGAALLDMPRRPLPGATDMPRVQMPFFGASERFAVSPGREEEGYFHMPSAQSGHPLSPFYGNGHEAWEEGKPTPFLSGVAQHTLVLRPN
ncbi:MAG TPA: penicillin acylase family protein [Acidobacteriota bacterium]|nr:penicillin acylase family protein [Acidobacteriota bacterium]